MTRENTKGSACCIFRYDPKLQNKVLDYILLCECKKKLNCVHLHIQANETIHLNIFFYSKNICWQRILKLLFIKKDMKLH